MTKDDLPGAFTRGVLSPDQQTAVQTGDRVRAKNINPASHTPARYARGHRRRRQAIRGCHVFPDSAATGAGENPQWLYAVVFDGRDSGARADRR
jgi:nitrile hydratase